jgi:hypothetical protein
MSSESVCQVARSWGGHGQFSHALNGEVYDYYSVGPECFGYTFVYKDGLQIRVQIWVTLTSFRINLALKLLQLQHARG